MKTKSLARKHGLLLLALCAAFLFIGGGVSADAKEILPTNVTTASSGCTLVGVEGSYLSQAQEALNRINAIRKEACDEGVPDPRDSSKNLSSSDYREIKWSSDLEYIARIRAAEASLTVAHARPSNAAGDSLSAFEVISPNGEQSWYEVLAWNGSRTMVSGIEQWYNEKTDWVTKKTDEGTGHYTAMINPKFNYVAIAEFINTNARFSNTVSGEFSHKTGLDETKAAAKADIIQTVEILNSKLSASLSLETATLEAGKTTTASIDFKANMYSTGSYKVTPLSVTYTSSDTSIATVSKDGTVTAKSAGTATITAKINDAISATATVTVENHTHTWDSGVVTKAATCTTAGVKTYTCSGCSETKIETIAATGHSAVTKNAKEATCTTTGYTGDSACSTCNTTLSTGKTIAATGKHSYDSGKVTKAATCTTTGTMTYTCTTCKQTETKSIDEIAHTPVIRNKKVETCTTAGYSGDSVCSTCGTTLSRGKEIAVKEHSYDNGKVTKEATCTTTGVKTYTCTVCGEENPESIPTNDEHDWEVTITSAKCEEDGYKLCECNRCGKTIKEITEKAYGHRWNTAFVTTWPTCTEKGTKTATCWGGDLEKVEEIPATGHNYKIEVEEATCTFPGTKTYICTNQNNRTGLECGDSYEEEIPATGHSWNKGKVTKAPTYTTTGVKTYTCTHCDETKKTTIAKLAYPKVGTSYTVGGNVYKVTKAGAEVAFVKAKANVKSLTIPATIRVSGITYKVTAINANAVKSNKKLKSAVIGANVKKIANGAFSKCKALKTVTFKTPLLTKKTASKKAFKSVHKKITLKVPKKVKASYKKIFKGMKVK